MADERQVNTKIYWKEKKRVCVCVKLFEVKVQPEKISNRNAQISVIHSPS